MLGNSCKNEDDIKASIYSEKSNIGYKYKELYRH